MFEITITQTIGVTRKNWEIIGEEPTTQEDANKSYDQKVLPKMKNLYGYVTVDAFDKEEIFKQTISKDDFNLKNIVAVINGIQIKEERK